MRGDEESLSDYLDGRLAPAEKAAFEARLAEDAALARRLKIMRATRESLRDSAPSMPADLKAALKREARARAAKPARSWRDAWRAAFGGGLGCGLGAAFAAGILVFAVRLALPARTAPSSPAAERPAPAWRDAAASAGLKSLWSDDDGRDKDAG